MDELITVPAAHLSRWWSFVREGLEEVIKRTHEEWLPEDIYVSLRQGESRLVLALRDDVFVGFAVVLDRTNPFNGMRTLVAWAVWVKRGIEFDPFVDRVCDAAEREGYDKVMFQSPRPGWVRRLWSHGFRPKETIFECILRERHGKRNTTTGPEPTSKH